MDPADAIGFSLIKSSEGIVRRYVLFNNSAMVPEEDIPPVHMDAIIQYIPFLDQERRSSHLPTAMLMQLRTCVERQEVEIARLKADMEGENRLLRETVLINGLEIDEDATSTAILKENLTLREETRKLNRLLDVLPFRDQVDKAKVAALQANITRMSGAIWSFAPIGRQLNSHTDPNVRESYKTNLSLLTMLQENCESALQNCQHLL